MSTSSRNNRKDTLARILIVILAVILQLFINLTVATWLKDKIAWIEAILHLLSVIITLMIIKNSRHLSSDVLWIVLINVFPIPGTILYLFLGADLILACNLNSY